METGREKKRGAHARCFACLCARGLAASSAEQARPGERREMETQIQWALCRMSGDEVIVALSWFQRVNVSASLRVLGLLPGPISRGLLSCDLQGLSDA